MFSIEIKNDWKPQTTNVLDLRLAPIRTFRKCDGLVCKKAAEMRENLQELYTQGCSISGYALATLNQLCPNLRRLDLRFAHNFDLVAILSISKMKMLEELNVQFVKFFTPEHPVTRLHRLEINFYEKPHLGRPPFHPRHETYFGDTEAETILNGCTNLKKINLSGTKISEKTLDLIAAKKNITYVNISFCSSLSQDAIRRFQAKCPHIVVSAGKKFEDDHLRELVNKIRDRFFVKKSGSYVPVFKEDITLEDQELLDQTLEIIQNCFITSKL